MASVVLLAYTGTRSRTKRTRIPQHLAQPYVCPRSRTKNKEEDPGGFHITVAREGAAVPIQDLINEDGCLARVGRLDAASMGATAPLVE